MIPRIISWPYWASQIVIAGPIGPAIISSLVKIVLTLLKLYENPGQVSVTQCSIAMAAELPSVAMVIISLLFVF